MKAGRGLDNITGKFFEISSLRWTEVLIYEAYSIEVYGIPWVKLKIIRMVRFCIASSCCLFFCQSIMPNRDRVSHSTTATCSHCAMLCYSHMTSAFCLLTDIKAELSTVNMWQDNMISVNVVDHQFTKIGWYGDYHTAKQLADTHIYFWNKMFFFVTMLFSSWRYSTASFLTASRSSFSFSTAFTRFNYTWHLHTICTHPEYYM